MDSWLSCFRLVLPQAAHNGVASGGSRRGYPPFTGPLRRRVAVAGPDDVREAGMTVLTVETPDKSIKSV